jgi:hypothetical protein
MGKWHSIVIDNMFCLPYKRQSKSKSVLLTDSTITTALPNEPYFAAKKLLSLVQPTWQSILNFTNFSRIKPQNNTTFFSLHRTMVMSRRKKTWALEHDLSKCSKTIGMCWCPFTWPPQQFGLEASTSCANLVSM